MLTPITKPQMSEFCNFPLQTCRDDYRSRLGLSFESASYKLLTGVGNTVACDGGLDSGSGIWASSSTSSCDLHTGQGLVISTQG